MKWWPSMFQRLTIRTQITAASAMVAALFAVLCGSALLATSHNRTKLSAIQVNHEAMRKIALPLARAALGMQIEVTQVQQYLQDVSATRGLDGLDGGFTEADTAANKFRIQLAKTRELTRQLNHQRLNAALDEIESGFEPYYALGMGMAVEYVNAGPAGGNRLMRSFDEHADRLRSALSRVAEISEDISLSSAEATNKSISALAGAVAVELRLTLVLALLAFALTGLIAFTMRNSVSSPINALSHKMKELAAGDLNAAIPCTSTNNEVGDMARAVAIFRTDAIERQRLTREARMLSEFNDWLQSAKSEDELYQMIADVMSRLIPNCTGSLFIYANSRDVLECAKVWNGESSSENMHPDDCWGLRRGRTYTHGIGDSEIHFHCTHAAGSHDHPYCCIPILAHGETVGLLHLEMVSGAAGDFASARRMGLACSEQISLAIANIKLREQLRDQSIRDALTGLYNRRYMLETCTREFARAKRSGQAVSLLSIDVDHFKKFNDNHGHDAGDTVLRVVGEAMRTTFREDDVACRFGGEEFVIVLPGCPTAEASYRAEEFRKRIEALAVRYAEGNLPRVTISIGVAAYPEAGTNPMAVLKVADDALYMAKGAGRNCVMTSSGQRVIDVKPAPDSAPADTPKTSSDDDQHGSDATVAANPPTPSGTDHRIAA